MNSIRSSSRNAKTRQEQRGCTAATHGQTYLIVVKARKQVLQRPKRRWQQA